MSTDFISHIKSELSNIHSEGLFKTERIITTPQSRIVALEDGSKVINLCANNYLGLSNNPSLIAAGKNALEDYGYGMSSVRFICGTQKIHKNLEQRLSKFLGFEDTILYSSCYDANTGLFETLLGSEDAIISDSLNHASIIDGVRLSKAQRFRYKNSDMQELEDQLRASSKCRFRLIATDGVFSMDGYIANLKEICDLAEKYKAMVMVDDSHAVGFIGKTGRGTHEYCNVIGRVDIMSGTLGKALGGASGGYISANSKVVELLRQRSRPYLFSNTLAPVIAATSIAVLDMLESSNERIQKLRQNTIYFRHNMQKAGFDILSGEHPIVPVMLRDPKLSQKMSEMLSLKGIYVAPFSFPVVPRGTDRIRTQMSAALEIEDLEFAIKAFRDVGEHLKII
ncbi:glycine C-acetyltransferase [Paracoccaceae bacterium]|jgi:glycine C-acetyltransferase|nr:glycine C-acetyltransferase [Paracoccaceae bacterium]|tara:strand:+ start:4856 stop:6043 length:1188 start_codon:yes stop_codon:yes gene_type:complete